MKRVQCLAKNGLIVNQVLTQIHAAVTEHRWKDALILIPAVIALEQGKICPYFIWKTVHIIMMNTYVSLEDQMKVLITIFKSPINNTEIALEWIAQTFKDVDMKNMEEVYQFGRQSEGINISNNPSERLFRAYHALYYYVEWKRKFVTLSSTKRTANEDMYEELRAQTKDCFQFGIKTHKMLTKAFTLCRWEKRDVQSKEHTKRQTFESELKGIAIEWILRPLLDVEDLLSLANKKWETANDAFSRTFEHDGLSIIQTYATEHSDHYPTLRLYYYYMLKNYSHETHCLTTILRSIVTLSPESHLVLEYVEHLMKHYSNKKEKNSMNENDEPCLFEVKDEEILFDCLRSLCRFVEYPMWQHDLRAWKLISTILQTIQFALINCFSCSHCEMSRRKLRNMIKTLELWPTLFWRIPEDKSLWSLAEVVSYAAYTAFMFGYDKEIVNQVSALLDKGRYMKEKNMLMSAIMQDGWCLRDFNVFLSSLKHEWIEDYPTNACTSNKESNFEEMELLPLRRFNVTVNTNVNFNSGNVKGIPYLAPRLRKAKKRTLEEEPKESHIFEVNLEDSILPKRKKRKVMNILQCL